LSCKWFEKLNKIAVLFLKKSTQNSFNFLNPIFVKIENACQKMDKTIKRRGYSYYEAGEAHLLWFFTAMGGLSNFDGVASYFSEKDIK
jgi:hypothetical protein